MNRDWKEFWIQALKATRYSLIGISLVPIFHVFLNPNWQHPDFFIAMGMTLRVGAEISIFVWLIYCIVYAVIFRIDPQLLISWKKNIGIQVVLGLLFMVIAMALASLLEPLISGQHLTGASMASAFLLGGITFLLCLFIAAYRQTHASNLKLRAESAEANLHVLRNQMQPHFLFNSFNTLSELIHSNHGQASLMTQQLADLYREILENSKKPLSSLSSEVSIIKKYLELEKLRFGERLRYSIEMPARLDEVFLPSLILQTLVENAVKHAISKSIEGVEILVKVMDRESGFQAEVANSGCSPKTDHRGGTGLDNTISRLDLLYGSKHSFDARFDRGSAKVSFWFSGENFGA